MIAHLARTGVAVLLASVLLLLGDSRAVAHQGAASDPNMPTEADRATARGRAMLIKEYPKLAPHMARWDGFGGQGSPIIGGRMLDRSPEVVAEARAKSQVEELGAGLWMIRFPYVNVGVVETKDGLVVLDTGYASAGPVIRDILPTLSKKPLKTIVYTHSHVDHAYGAWALKERWPNVEVIATKLLPVTLRNEMRLRGSIGRYNNQSIELMPKADADMVMPTTTFDERLERTIGGERFVFIHAPGETEDQLYVWLPDRRTVVTADYYQGFLPNAGNGKRMQRYVEEWIGALRNMAELKPELLLPMHGAALRGKANIRSALTLHADALQHVVDHTLDGLNRGTRKDIVVSTVEWPERFAKAPLLAASYNRPEDIATMVARRWTGWWDDIPSHFAAVTFDEEAKEALVLAGGVDAVEQRARALLATKPRLAARLADWARFGAPNDLQALRLAVDIYVARIMAPDTPTQESSIYLDAAASARARMAEISGSKTDNHRSGEGYGLTN